MNIYLLHLVGKWISFLIVGVTSIFHTFSIDKIQMNVDNDNNNKNISVVNEVIEHETNKKYNVKLPKNKIKVITEGVDGIIQKDGQGNISHVVREMVPEELEVGTGPNGLYTGKMTAYTANCLGCSKVGNVACFTENKTKHSLVNQGVTYEDNEYGSVAILSADRSVFPCGTIIKVTHPNKEPFIGVVMDTGSAMQKAWRENGQILIDLAMNTESTKEELYAITNHKVSYSVERFGW